MNIFDGKNPVTMHQFIMVSFLGSWILFSSCYTCIAGRERLGNIMSRHPLPAQRYWCVFCKFWRRNVLGYRQRKNYLFESSSTLSINWFQYTRIGLIAPVFYFHWSRRHLSLRNYHMICIGLVTCTQSLRSGYMHSVTTQWLNPIYEQTRALKPYWKSITSNTSIAALSDNDCLIGF